ncbi:MAG TPA: hypothetical protein ENJ53_09060, partial [Phaeodactylibacter sp.]|nr:hypothetical protein [Phaeodactylibacter sp.]
MADRPPSVVHRPSSAVRRPSSAVRRPPSAVLKMIKTKKRKMTIIQLYQKGWKKVWENKRMWILLYLLNFVFALLSAGPFSDFLKKTVGETVATAQMLDGFDYTFISDFMREYGEGFSVILNLSLGIMLLYFLFSIFWMGGILSILKNKNTKFQVQYFLQSSAYFFWRLVRLTFYFILIQVAVFGSFAFILMQMGISPFEVKSEIKIINTMKFMLPIYLLITTVFFMIQDYAKVHIIHHKIGYITQPIREAFRFVYQNFKKCFGLYLLNLLTFLFFFGVYWLASNSFQSNTDSTI